MVVASLMRVFISFFTSVFLLVLMELRMMITGAEDSEPDIDTDEMDNASDDDTLDESIVPDDIRASINAVNSLNLVDQQETTVGCDETDGMGEDKDTCEQVKSDESEATQARKMEDNEDQSEIDLLKRLNKHAKHAISAARGKKNFASRNTYKDKGGKKSSNSKLQNQVHGW